MKLVLLANAGFRCLGADAASQRRTYGSNEDARDQHRETRRHLPGDRPSRWFAPELHHGAGQPATAAHHATGEHLEAGENDARQQTLIGLGVGRRDAPDPFRPLVE